MSDNVAQSCNGSEGVSKQAVNSQRSVWMAHWMSSTTSCKPSAKQACGRLSISVESRQDDRVAAKQQQQQNDSECGKGLSEMAETKRVKVLDESAIAGPERLRSPFPMFNLLQRKGDGVESSSHAERDQGNRLVSLRGSERPEGVSEYPKEEAILESNSLAITNKSLKEDFMASSSKIVPYGFSLGKTAVRSTCKQVETSRSKSVLESGERTTNAVYHSSSVCLVNEKAVNDLFGKSRNPFVKPNELALWPHNPTTSRSQQPEFVSKQCHKTQDRTGMELFPRKNSPIEVTKSKKLYRECFSLPSLPCSEHDMEATRHCTTVDSMEESSKGLKRFSTTHNFRVTKRTAFDLSEGGHMLKESTESAKMKEKVSPELFRVDRPIGFPIRTGLKLKLLGSSTASDEVKEAGELQALSVNLKNESSVETNTMDLDTFWKNHVSGVVSSSSNKHIELEQRSPTSHTALALAREVRGRPPKAKLPDINQEPNNLAAYGSSADTSTSKTQSLDAEHLLSNAEQPTNFKSTACFVGCLEPELSSRWVKRLKLSPSSALGTQSSKMGEDYSHEKVSNVFSKIMKCSLTSSEPITGRSNVKEQGALNQRTNLWNGKSSSSESVRENREVLLLHPWIQRLRHNPVSSTLEKSKSLEISKPQGSKATVGEFQDKQFPSLAAMALMGKAMVGFRSCQFRKKGCSVVWSS